MASVVWLLKFVGAPGSIALLVVCCAGGLLFIRVWPRNRRLGQAWLAAVLLSYIILGLPIVANAIADRLPVFKLPADLHARGVVNTLVVLDGDNRRGRVRQTIQTVEANAPELVLVSGDDWLRDELVRAGLPQALVEHETASANTRDQVALIVTMLAADPQRRVAVIGSRLQMPRIAALVRRARASVGLIPSPVDTEPPTRGLRLFVPSYTALRVSRDALYEHAALRYYRWRGWI
jgi:uncharacterized SAM-binding protein YcdF (DUF218 family)